MSLIYPFTPILILFVLILSVYHISFFRCLINVTSTSRNVSLRTAVGMHAVLLEIVQTVIHLTQTHASTQELSQPHTLKHNKQKDTVFTAWILYLNLEIDKPP